LQPFTNTANVKTLKNKVKLLWLFLCIILNHFSELK
jgi:hypothetical protein